MTAVIGVYLLVMCISETTEVARDSFANLFPVVQPKWNRQYIMATRPRRLESDASLDKPSGR